jgi:hypothetical protein
MAANSFARIGYANAQNGFTPVNVRAQDVETTTGVTAEVHITNGTIHVSADQAQQIAGAVQSSALGAVNGVATLGSDGKVVAAQLPDSALTVADFSVADIDALTELTATAAPLNSDIFVNDASDDPTVTSGWALYRRTGTAGNLADWTKLAEGEGLDVAFVDQTARDAAGAAQTAQTAAQTAQTAANLIDAAYCADEEDLAEMNLREGALALMAVSNASVDEPAE